MTRYWIIAPYQSQPPEKFDKIWQFDLENGVVSIGWQGFGDPRALTKDQLTKAVDQREAHKPKHTRSLIVNMLWSFYHEIKTGDVIVARRGRKILAGVGRVTGEAKWSPEKNFGSEHSGFLEVEWENTPRERDFGFVIFPMHTLSEMKAEKFESLMGLPMAALPIAAVDEEQAIDENNLSFVLEKYLEEFIVSNFSTIFQNELKIFSDGEGSDGQQYTTDIGPIDILAFEESTNSFVVIELKKGRPTDQVVGQVLRYMGWVKKELCTEGQGVKGLVICQFEDKKLTYALSMVTNIDLKYYSVSFSLRDNP